MMVSKAGSPGSFPRSDLILKNYKKDPDFICIYHIFKVVDQQKTS